MNVRAVTTGTPARMPSNLAKNSIHREQAAKPIEQSAPATPLAGSSIESPPIEAALAAPERLPTLGTSDASGSQYLKDSGTAKNAENSTAFVDRLQKLLNLTYGSTTLAQSNVPTDITTANFEGSK